MENLPCNQGYDLESMKIPHCHLGAAIVNEEPTKIDFWYMMTVSPMTQVPNTNMVKKALEKVSFAVVVDNLMTSHALYYKPIVTYIQADELIKNKSSKLRDKYPLMAVQRKLARSIHSSFSTLPWVNEVHSSEPEVMIHPNDAKKRGIKANDRVIIYNDRGEHRAKAEVTYHIKEGIISLENGWWEQSGGSTSYVTNDKVEVLGNGQSCNNTLVDIRKES